MRRRRSRPCRPWSPRAVAVRGRGRLGQGAGVRAHALSGWPGAFVGHAAVKQLLTETFLFWNVLTLTLDMQRESLRLSWFATGGAFEHDATGRGQTETETFTQNVWTAPATPGPVYFWTVLRDDRGGIDFDLISAEIDVTP